MTTIKLLNEYLQSFFGEHQPEKLLGLLTEDVHCYGFAEDKVIENKEQGREMLAMEKYLRFQDFLLEIVEEKQISEETAMVAYNLTYQGVSIRYRLTGNSRMTDAGRKLCLLHFSMINPRQTLHLFDDLIEQREQTVKREWESLRQGKMVTELAAAFADIWVITYDTKRGICYPDERLCKKFHFPKIIEGFPESMFSYRLILPQYKEVYCSSFHRLCQGEKRIDFDIQTKYLDGSIHWIRFRGQLLPEVTKEGVSAVISAQEIDTEKAMEARIELEEKQQASGAVNLLAHFITNLTKNVPVAHTYHFEERPKLQEWPSIETQLSRTKKYVVKAEKQKEFEKIHDTKRLLAQFARGKTEETLEYRRMMPDGRIIWVRSVLHLMQEPRSGDILNYEYIYNIHEQRISEELLSAVVVFGFERCASLMVDSNQVTILRSPKECGKTRLEVTEYTRINEWYAQRILPQDRENYLRECALDNIRERLKNEEHFETMHRTMEDGVIHYKKDQCFRYSKEHAICLLIRSDVSDVVMQEQQKQLQLKEALKTAESATKAKSEFLSRMSHEIRTPMNAIMGMTAIAKENQSDFLQVEDCLDKIDMSSHYLLTLINDILEMSRIESGRTQIQEKEFDFHHLIESIRTVIEPLAMKRGIRYEFVNHAGTCQMYRGDMLRIQQVMVNLLTNAIKFTKPRGKVRFRVNIEEEGSQSTKFRFVVSDTGIGMSEKFMSQMFQPFVQEDSGNTSEYGGSGLGLAISKSLTEAMGGKIEVESFQGVGSTFTVTLPLKRTNEISSAEGEKDTQTKAQEKIDWNCMQGRQILMAEDHPLNVLVAEKLLEGKGMLVTIASNGREAMEKFEKSEPYFYDAILMDIRMPVMDGLDAAKNIRSMNRADAKTIPIIAMTANALDEDRKKSKEAGMNDHLAKPFEPNKLYTTLFHVIREKEGKGYDGEWK